MSPTATHPRERAEQVIERARARYARHAVIGIGLAAFATLCVLFADVILSRRAEPTIMACRAGYGLLAIAALYTWARLRRHAMQLSAFQRDHRVTDALAAEARLLRSVPVWFAGPMALSGAVILSALASSSSRPTVYAIACAVHVGTFVVVGIRNWRESRELDALCSRV